MSVPTVTILSDGKTISPEWAVLSVDIRREINRIATAAVTFVDGDAATGGFDVSESASMNMGRSLEIKLRWEGETRDTTVFKGPIVRQGIQAAGASSQLTIEAKDAAVRMTHGRRTALFRQMSDSDVIGRVVKQHGLRARVASTTAKHAELMQYQCTDWDFVVTRASAAGLVIAVEDGVLAAQVPDVSKSAKAKFSFGIDEIFEFEFEADASRQLVDLKARGWALKDKNVLAEKGTSFRLKQGDWNGQAAAKALGYAETEVVHDAAVSKAELGAWASARVRRNRLAFLRGRLTVMGTAQLSLLDLIEIDRVGKRFNGTTLVTGLCHRVDRGGWTTDVQFGFPGSDLSSDDGVEDRLAAGLIPAVNGLHIGVVSKFAEDPDGTLRLKVTLPVLGETVEVWARLATPDAGNKRGTYFRPEPDDEVVVGFFNNDPRSAVVLGSLFSAKNAAPTVFGKPAAKNPAKGFVSRSGTTIGFLDEDKPSVFIETPAKNKLLLDDQNKLITVTDQHGNAITLDDKGITLKSYKAITIEAKGDLQLKATGNVTIEGQKVDVK